MTPARIFGRLVRECVSFPGHLLAVMLSLLAVTGGQLYLTWLAKLWVERAVNGHDAAAFRAVMGRATLTIAAVVTGVFIARYLLNSVNQRLVERLRNQIHARVLSMGVLTVSRRPTGEWLSRVLNDTGALSGLVRDILRRVIGEGTVVVGALAMMFYLHWRFALAAWVLVPGVAWLLIRLGNVIRRRATVSQQALAALSATLNEQLLGFRTVKSFQGEPIEHGHFRFLNAACRRAVLHSESWACVLVALVWLFTGAGLLTAVWYGSGQALSGQMTAGELLAFCFYAAQTVEPMRRLSEAHGMLQAAIASATRVYELIDTAADECAEGGHIPAPVRGDLRFRDVRFGYCPDTLVLAGIDLRIRAGENVALVAASGGGKSTLASLLIRFAEPQHGQILLDGRDLRTLRLPELRRTICVIEQHPWIFSGSLIDNVRYGSWEASRVEVDAAVALVGLAPLVRELPAGLQSPLQEGGSDLSAGQKQRIALARAVVRNPAVVVFDEATSALDSEAEAQIFARLEQWLRTRTALVMAHRLATVSRFDRVVVIQGGRVIADGPVAELVRSCAAFAQLFGEQLVSVIEPDERRVHAF